MKISIPQNSSVASSQSAHFKEKLLQNGGQDEEFANQNHIQPQYGLGKCYGNNGWCGCGQFQEQPGNSWWCKCGHHYDDHGS
jgi:hypothetical protein